VCSFLQNSSILRRRFQFLDDYTGVTHDPYEFILLKKGNIFVNKINPCLDMGQHSQEGGPSLLDLMSEITP
jgi:hypothetical protein